MLELFCDDLIHMTQKIYTSQLLYLSRTLQHGIHSVFPTPHVSGNNGRYPISMKKLESGEGQWAVRKEVLGWMVDGATWCIKLAWDKKSVIDAELHKIVRMTKGVPFKRIKILSGKIQNAETVVPTGKKFMTPIKKILLVKLQIVRWKYFPAVKQALQDWRTLLKEAVHESTTAKEFFVGDPVFLVWVDASREIVGGIWLPGKDVLEPNIWRLEWPKKLRARLITSNKIRGRLGYKRSRIGRKDSDMARVGRNSWHRKTRL